jgi:DNA modification methylase
MKLMPDEVIDLTFTSPPYYNARDYSIYSSYGEYLDFLREVFNNLLRITREGRFLVVNSSPVIVPRVSRAHASRRYPIPFDLHGILVQNGWEFIDDIIWVKPEASAKNRNAGFLQNRKPLAYKPNSISEMLMVYRKKTDKLIDWNIRQYPKEIVQKSLVKDGYETSNIWYVDPTFSKKHSAVFPKELCKKVIEYYSFIGDLVFDPFAGSGTLGQVAIECNRKFFLTEVDKNYFSSIKSLFTTPNLFQSDFDVAFFNQKSFRDRIDKNK